MLSCLYVFSTEILFKILFCEIGCRLQTITDDDRQATTPHSWFAINKKSVKKASKVALFTGGYIFLVGLALLAFPESLFGKFVFSLFYFLQFRFLVMLLVLLKLFLNVMCLIIRNVFRFDTEN